MERREERGQVFLAILVAAEKNPYLLSTVRSDEELIGQHCRGTSGRASPFYSRCDAVLRARFYDIVHGQNAQDSR